MFIRKITDFLSMVDPLEEARQKLEDVAMRRALYELMWKKAHLNSTLPMPMLSDKQVRAELRRILK